MWDPFADDEHIFRIIRAVQRAPSVYNTQPWSFRIVADDRIELWPHWVKAPGHSGAWLDRQLPYTDRAARELTISCGAALFNLRMAIRMSGHEVSVSLLPYERRDPPLLASVEIVTSRVSPPTAQEQELYDAIERRHTYRWPFTGPRVHHNIITELILAALQEKAHLRELYPFQVSDWLRATARAEAELMSSPRYLAELRQWTEGTDSPRRELGVSADTFGPPPASHHPPVRHFSRDSADGWLGEKFESHPQLLSLATDYNRPLDWLRAGQALQRVLLTATRYGVAASFLTQSLELADRQQLADDELAGRRLEGDRRRLPSRIDLADDSHHSRRWPQPRGWAFEETPQMIIRVGYPDRDGPQTPREFTPQVYDLRSGSPRLVPPPGRPGRELPGS